MRFRALFLALILFVASCERNAVEGETMTYYDLCKSNLELAREGRLAEDVFCHIQHSSAGLALEWERDGAIAELMSEIYYEAGHIALSQRYAFEANLFADGKYNPDMLRRLVTTNIIYGAYPVAEKYITVLETDKQYGRWAREQRRFLWNDAAVEEDPEYGAKRKCIPAEDFFATASGVGFEDLEHVIDANPDHHNSIEYLGVYYLLDCDFERFGALMEKYYGTRALPRLPRSFAEAVCIMSEDNPGYWKKFDVNPAVFRRYRDFVNRLSTGLSMEKFKDTFWYYVMLMNNER